MNSRRVAQVGGAPRLVEGGPHRHPVTKGTGHDGRVLGKTQGGVAVGPAAGVLELLWQVPVVEGDDRLDRTLEQRVDKARVEVETLAVDGARPTGDDPWP